MPVPNHSQLRAGSSIEASDHPASNGVEDSTTQTNISSTSFVTGSPELGITFTAPDSGRAIVCVGGIVRDNGGSNRVFLTFQVFEGEDDSGTEFLAPSVYNGISNYGVQGDYAARGNMTLLEGLTPGQVYYARTVHAVTGGSTCDINTRDIMAFPTT